MKKSNQQKDYIETDFLAGIERILAARLSLAAWFIPLALMTLIILLIVWAWVAEVDVSSPNTGEIVPSKEVQLVQTKEVGVVEAMYVENGGQVKKGQLLVKLDDVDISGELAQTQQQLEQMAIEMAVLQQQKQCFAHDNHCADINYHDAFPRARVISGGQEDRQGITVGLSEKTMAVARQLFTQRWQDFLAQKALRENQIKVLQSELAQKNKN